MSNHAAREAPDARSDTRLSEQSWIEAALRHIAHASVDDIRVEHLARELAVTKGSFYWHLRDRQHLLQRVLEYWTEHATVRITEWSKSGSGDGVARLARLLALPADAPPEKHGAQIELAMRSWARRDETAEQVVANVDRMRFKYLVELICELGFKGQEAQQRAAIAQSYMLGDSLLKAGLSRAERAANARVCAEIIARPAMAADDSGAIDPGHRNRP